MSTGHAKRNLSRIAATVRCALLVLATSMALVAPAGAQNLAALPQIGAIAIQSGPARPIAAWTIFCARYTTECAIASDEPERITLTPTVWQTIVSVNRRVNKGLNAVTDQDHWNAADRWDLGEDGSGDCEDFQLLKRRMLAEGGLPRRAMRMTVVIDEKGEGHAVLTILTDRGDFVLDNKSNAVLPWGQTGYTFIKRERTDAPGWIALGRSLSPTTTANR